MTVGKKIAAGYVVVLALQAVVGWFAYSTTSALIATGRASEHTHVVLEGLGGLLSLLADAETGQRGFVLTGENPYLEPYNSALSRLDAAERELKSLTSDNPNQQRRLDELHRHLATKLAVLAETIETRRKGGLEAALKVIQSDRGKEAMDAIRRIVGEAKDEERALLEQRNAAVAEAARQLNMTVIGGFAIAVIASLGIAIVISLTLSKQIGSAATHIQSSSTELQAVASQQASGMKEQVSSMTEITTTIRELLSTSRQIAESAQRVVRMADAASGAALSGDKIVSAAQGSIDAIKRQVDLVVAHMLELGKRSQQIGSVLEIVNELLEQTNILAINATIEASGAGDHGRRFSAVADEIRKLSDRVGGSAKEIRGLVDEVRAAVNATVMATEGGAKAVDAGTREFHEVTQSFKRITTELVTTAQAAREIELSTKQQTSAVEQVNVAIANVAQASKETEASATQTLQTASQLTSLSRDLSRLVQTASV